MKVLFVNPATKFNARNSGIPLGIIAIATYLKEKGHIIKIVDRTLGNFDVVKAAEEFAPDIIGISVVGYKSAPDAEKISKKLKELNYTVAWGGPFAACAYDIVFASELADYVFSGEGELSWEELLEALEGKNGRKIEDVDGVYCYIDGKLHFNGQHALADLSTFPVMDFSLVNPADYFQENFGCKKMLHLCSAKGCPNNCTFCYNKDFHRCVYRKRPMSQVLDEIVELNKNYGMNGVYFADELWCRNKEEMHNTCDALKSLGLDFVWGCQTRIGQFTEEDFRYMYNSGCRWIFFGVESGSPRILKLMNKHIPYDRIVPTFSDCRKAGITAIASFIAGFPDETEEDLMQSVALIEKLDTSFVNLNYYALVPGSDMHKKLVAEGKYPQYTDIVQVANIKPVERIEYKFCSVPDTELKVIQTYYMWRSFTSKDASTGRGNSFAVKVITDAVKSVFGGNFINFFMSTFYSGISFLKIVFYSHAFPKIKKKYGISR